MEPLEMSKNLFWCLELYYNGSTIEQLRLQYNDACKRKTYITIHFTAHTRSSSANHPCGTLLNIPFMQLLLLIILLLLSLTTVSMIPTQNQHRLYLYGRCHSQHLSKAQNLLSYLSEIQNNLFKFQFTNLLDFGHNMQLYINYLY